MSSGVEDHEKGFRKCSGNVLEKHDEEGEIPVRETPIDPSGTRVVPDT